MSIESASRAYRANPDVYFRDAHKILVKILTNIVSEPTGDLLLVFLWFLFFWAKKKKQKCLAEVC
jgi:hypothetical protein